MLAINIDVLIYDSIDYTKGDDIAFQLLEIFICPIVQDYSDDCIIFNHQLYDRKLFMACQAAEQRINNQFIQSGYSTTDPRIHLKDPRTGINFPYIEDVNTLLKVHPHYEDYLDIIVARINGITIEQAKKYLPDDVQLYHGTLGTACVVEHVKGLCFDLREKREVYTNRIKEIQNIAAMNCPTYSASQYIPDSLLSSSTPIILLLMLNLCLAVDLSPLQ